MGGSKCLRGSDTGRLIVLQGIATLVAIEGWVRQGRTPVATAVAQVRGQHGEGIGGRSPICSRDGYTLWALKSSNTRSDHG